MDLEQEARLTRGGEFAIIRVAIGVAETAVAI